MVANPLTSNVCRLKGHLLYEGLVAPSNVLLNRRRVTVRWFASIPIDAKGTAGTEFPSTQRARRVTVGMLEYNRSFTNRVTIIGWLIAASDIWD